MSTAIQRRRGTTAQHATFTGLLGELTVDTDKNTVVVHDGTTAGGHALPTVLTAGDVFSNTATSVASEVPLFDGTTGKAIKRSKIVLTPVATGSTLTIADGKTITHNATITISGVDGKTVTFTDGCTVNTNTLTFAGGGVLTLTANKNLTLAGALATSGAHDVTLTLSADSNVTLPTTGTLATLAGAETLAAKVMQGESSLGVAKGSVGTGTVTFDVSAGNFQSLTVTGSLTIAFSNWAASGKFSAIILQEINWGSATVTTPTINWQLPAGGFTTTFATYLTAIGRSALQTSGTDWGMFWTVDGGTTIYGKLF